MKRRRGGQERSSPKKKKKKMMWEGSFYYDEGNNGNQGEWSCWTERERERLILIIIIYYALGNSHIFLSLSLENTHENYYQMTFRFFAYIISIHLLVSPPSHNILTLLKIFFSTPPLKKIFEENLNFTYLQLHSYISIENVRKKQVSN